MPLIKIIATGGIIANTGHRLIAIDWNDPFIQGDSLVPHKARILLMLGLTKTKDPKKLQRIFNEY